MVGITQHSNGKKASFNTVYVLDSPLKGELKTGQNLADWLKLRSLKGDIAAYYFKISSKKALIKCLHEINQNIRDKQAYPILHFEMHGSIEGLFIRNELIHWSNLLTLLRTINMASGNNLVVAFAVCHAAFLYPEIDIFKPAPFFAVYGCINPVSFASLDGGFSRFYEELLSSYDGISALNALNAEVISPNEMFECLFAHSFFEWAWKGYDKRWDAPSTKYQKIQALMTEALSKPALRKRYTIPALRYELEMLTSKTSRAKTKAEMLSYFLMQSAEPYYYPLARLWENLP